MRILVLGAGFGGLELAARLSEEFGEALDLTLVDRNAGFVFGFSKLDVMFGTATAQAVHHPYADLAKPGVRFVRSTIRRLDPVQRRVVTDDGTFDADVLVVALGADLDPAATEGLAEAGHEFYTEAGAFALQPVLAGFPGGHVVIAVTSTPFKCPPAPSETALLVHDFLTRRQIRDISTISLVMPLGTPIPPSPDTSAALLEVFAERGIDWHPARTLVRIVPDRRVALLDDGAELPFDLLLAVPVHRVPQVVAESGMAEDGWIPVDPLTLRTRFPGVYAVGDVTSVGTPKAGVFAEGQAAVVAAQISAQINGATTSREYDGHGVCYLEFGDGRVGKVDITFAAGRPPSGRLIGPSAELAADKERFGADRVARWFGRA